MSLQFPSAPTVGEVYDRYTWTGEVWDLTPGTGGGGGGGVPRPADGCSLAYLVGQSIPNAAWTALTWDIERFDTIGMHDAAQPTRITITEAGRYLFNYRFSYFAAAGGTQRLGRMQKNGDASSLIGHDLGWPSATLEAMVNGTAVLDLEVGDYVECLAFQDSGAAIPTQGVQSAGNLVYFEAVKLETGGGGGAGSDGFTFTQDTEPTATGNGQTWFNTATGDAFVWVVDVDSSQWVQFAPGGGSGASGPRVGGIFDRTAPQTLPAGTFTTIVFDRTVFNNGLTVAPASNTFAVPETGEYAITLTAAVGAPGVLNVQFGGESFIWSSPSDVATGWATVAGTLKLTAGQIVSVRAWAQAAGNVTQPRLEIWKLGPA